MTKTKRAHLLLFLTAFIWGTSFVAQSAGMDHLGPFSFNALRYGLGVLALLPFILARRPKLDRAFFKRGILIGLVLFVSSSLQQNALLTATAGKAGFITSLYIIFVPILSQIFGHKVNLRHWLAVAAALLGLYLMTYGGSGAFTGADLMLLIGSIGYSIHIISIGRWGKNLDALALSATQFAVAATLSLLAALAFERGADLGAVLGPALPSLLYTGFLSCGVAYTLQIVAMKDSHPNVASMIMGLEAVFAVLGGALILKERFSPNEILGSLLMLAAVFYVQYVENKLAASEIAPKS